MIALQFELRRKQKNKQYKSLGDAIGAIDVTDAHVRVSDA